MNRSVIITLIILLGWSPVITQENNSASNSLKIIRISSLKLPSVPVGLYIEDNYCYVADLDSGLQIIDVSDINNPKLVGSLNNVGITSDVIINGQIAYIASIDSGLQIVDITNRRAPSKVSGLSSIFEATDLEMSGQYIYLVNREALYIINVENTSNPILSGKYYPLFYSTSVGLKNNYAFSLHCHYREEYCTLVIIDITNPAKPVEVSHYDRLEFWDQLIINNNILFVAGYNDGLRIFDISTISKPHLISNMNTLDSPTDFYLSEGKIFLTESNVSFNGVEIVDCDDPKTPKSVGIFCISGTARALFVKGDIIFVASDSLVILKYQQQVK
jgi:hypothetical protein